MAGLEAPEWAEIFVPDGSLLGSFLRGTVVYFAVLILIRIVPKRQLGSVGMTDVLLLVLLSECVSQVLNANSSSLWNGVAAVVALLFWNFFLDWLSYRWQGLREFLEHQPVPLVRDGQPLRDNLKKERIPDEELLVQLRQKGFDGWERVKTAMIEPEGKVSVVPMFPLGSPAPAPDEVAGGTDFESALRRFLQSARALRESVDWHEAQATQHRKSARAARDALARHGLRGRKVFDHLVPSGTNGPGRNGHPATGSMPDEDQGTTP